MFGSFLSLPESTVLKKSVGCSAVFAVVGCGSRFAVFGLVLRAAFAVSAIGVNFNNKSEILADGYTACSVAFRVRASASAVTVGTFAVGRFFAVSVIVFNRNSLYVVIARSRFFVGAFRAARKTSGAAYCKNRNNHRNRLFHKTSMLILKSFMYSLEKNFLKC